MRATPIHEGGTPVVRKAPPERPQPLPDGPPVYTGDPGVVEAWRARARREERLARAGTLGIAVVGAIAAAGGVAPPIIAFAALAGAALLYPLLVVVTGSRAAQRGFEVHATGVWGTERRRLLRFRRFAPWTDLTMGEAREVAPGRFHLQVGLLGGSVLSSIPGELSREAVDYINERAAEQIRIR